MRCEYHYSVRNVGKLIYFAFLALEKGHESDKLCAFISHNQLNRVLFQLLMLELNEGKGHHTQT